jgi:iron complex outermembrane recepter protein
MQLVKIAVAIATALTVFHATAAERLPEVHVEGSALPPDTRETATPAAALDLSLPADGGEALRGITGVSGARMGGHGIDPVIHGQTQTQLNILLDGAYVHGGCPNRMDPPTAYSPVDSYDRVTVQKGYQSVQHGGGGSGGTVLLERHTPRFVEDESVRARASAGYKTNSDSRSLTADVAAGTPQGFARAIAGYHDAGNYSDGDGHSVRSAFRNRSGTVLVGYTPDDHTRLEAQAEGFRERDVLFAGAGMDGVYSDNDIYRLHFSRDRLEGPLSGVNVEIYRSNVSHLMDNYSLRPLAAGAMRMRVPTSSDTTGGRASVDLPVTPVAILILEHTILSYSTS